VSETFASFFWSPDGTKLALDLGSTLAIATFSPTLTVTPVTGAEQSGNVVSWSPDSRYLLVNGYVIEKTSLVDTNDPTPSLIHLARYVEYGTWSADSTLLAGYDEVLYEVVAFDVGAPGTAHLVVNAVGVAKLEFSPIAPLLAVYGLGAQVHDLSSLPFVVPYWDLATFSTVTGGSWDLAGTRLAYTTSNTIWYSVTSANAVSAAVQADGVTAMDSLPRWQP
jgi:WD40 repeat protein